MKQMKKIFCAILLSLTVITASETAMYPVTGTIQVQAAAKVKLNKTKLTIDKGETYQLKVKNTKKKVTWSSKNKSIATVNKKGVVKGRKAGTTTITAKVGKKKYTCKVTVQEETKAADKQKAAVLKLINQERKAVGLTPLKMDIANLNAAADVRAKELAKSFSHTRPDGSSCFTILDEEGYEVSWYTVGENIAAGYSDAKSVMEGWMNSPGHRANILNSSYDQVGIGYYYNPSKPYQHYWVQMFVAERK